jgi:AAA domain
MPKVNVVKAPIKPAFRIGPDVDVLNRIRPMGFLTALPIKAMVYGVSGTGKTSFWSTFPSPIIVLLITAREEPGELISIDTEDNRKRIKQVEIYSTEEIRKVLDHIVETKQYRTVVIDHVSGMQDLTLKEILGIDHIPADKHFGIAKKQHWGELAVKTKTFIRPFLNIPNTNVCLIAQERDFIKRGSGDDDDAPIASSDDILVPTVGPALIPGLAHWCFSEMDYFVQTCLREQLREVSITLEGGGTEVTYEPVRGETDFLLRVKRAGPYMIKFRVVRGRKLPSFIVDPTYEKLLALSQGKSVTSI